MGPDLWVGSFMLMTSSSTSPTGPISLCAPASQNCALANSEAGSVSPLGSVRHTMRPIISWICKGWAPEAGELEPDSYAGGHSLTVDGAYILIGFLLITPDVT